MTHERVLPRDRDRQRARRLPDEDLLAEALLAADPTEPAIAEVVSALDAADGVVVASPVYKAAYSGVLKAFLDLLPQDGLKGKLVLPLATGGSQSHMLALDYALRPVLSALGARHVLPSIYATDAQVLWSEQQGLQLDADIAERIADGVERLAASLLTLRQSAVHEPVPFSQVRCSV